VRDLYAALAHHLHQVPIRQPIRDIPAYAMLNDIGVEGSLAVDRIAGNRLRHSAPRKMAAQSTRCPQMHQNHIVGDTEALSSSCEAWIYGISSTCFADRSPRFRQTASLSGKRTPIRRTDICRSSRVAPGMDHSLSSSPMSPGRRSIVADAL
jgi:hypothetical protein